MRCDVGKVTKWLENEVYIGEVMERLENELSSLGEPSMMKTFHTSRYYCLE